jgi:hypothetical protein
MSSASGLTPGLVLRLLSGPGPVLRILQAGRSPDAEEGLDAEERMRSTCQHYHHYCSFSSILNLQQYKRNFEM